MRSLILTEAAQFSQVAPAFTYEPNDSAMVIEARAKAARKAALCRDLLAGLVFFVVIFVGGAALLGAGVI